MAIGTAAAIIGSAIIGGVASNRAASQQAKQQKKAIAAQNELLGPFSDAGAAGLPGVQDFVNEGGNFSDTVRVFRTMKLDIIRHDIGRHGINEFIVGINKYDDGF